jgi:hypothetical protein
LTLKSPCRESFAWIENFTDINSMHATDKVISNATSNAATETVSLSAGWQVGASVLILLHLLAICLAPLAMSTRSVDGPSPIIAPLFRTFEPYIDATFLNHAYYFFAPNPGPSHIARYEFEFTDGRALKSGEFPNKKEHWPRLLYHRHFMLSETLYERFAPPDFPVEPTPRDDSKQAVREYNRALERWQRAKAEWEASRERYEALRRSVVNHLQVLYGADQVRLLRVEHRQPSADEFQFDHLPLTHESLYRVLPETSQAEVLPWMAPKKP